MLCAVIMAGGRGTRFWPLSTDNKPKQFLSLIDEETMIQKTINRILPIIPLERIFVCTGKKYVNLVKEQLPNLPERNIIVEPEGKNTAPCIALSALTIKRYYGDSTMVVLPSDHLIREENKFREILIKADNFLKKHNKGLMTLGMNPDRPETGYGYINCGKEIDDDINKVEAFVEKPNKEKAEEYLKLGGYLWNGGMFLWKVNTILDEIKKYIPNTYEALQAMQNIDEEDIERFVNEQYQKVDEISIDYAVLEKSDDIYVIKSDIGWDDIGTWRAIERYREKDGYNNIYFNNTVSIDSSNNMVIGNHNNNVVMIGVSNVATIVSDEGIYVINRELLDDVKDFKEGIKNNNNTK